MLMSKNANNDVSKDSPLCSQYVKGIIICLPNYTLKALNVSVETRNEGINRLCSQHSPVALGFRFYARLIPSWFFYSHSQFTVFFFYLPVSAAFLITMH